VFEDHMTITRREAIQRVGAMLGGLSLVGGSALLTACEKTERPKAPVQQPIGQFTLDDIAYLDEIADTILPTTSTPGAKAAHTGAFMALMVTDAYKPEDAEVFRAGMRTLDNESTKESGKTFTAATPPQRLTLLERIDREAKAHMDARSAARKAKADSSNAIAADTPTHYFRMMKELAMLGYFTSEIGCTQAMRYVESPGRYDPCLPYQPGERSWAGHA
jgi:hypothetical protein